MAPGDYRKIIVINDEFDRFIISNPFQANIYELKSLNFINSIRDLVEIKNLNNIFILNPTLYLVITETVLKIYQLDSFNIQLKENFFKKSPQLLMNPLI